MGESEQPIICGNIARQSFDRGRLSRKVQRCFMATRNAFWVNKPTAFIFRRKRPTEAMG